MQNFINSHFYHYIRLESLLFPELLYLPLILLYLFTLYLKSCYTFIYLDLINNEKFFILINIKLVFFNILLCRPLPQRSHILDLPIPDHRHTETLEMKVFRHEFLPLTDTYYLLRQVRNEVESWRNGTLVRLPQKVCMEGQEKVILPTSTTKFRKMEVFVSVTTTTWTSFVEGVPLPVIFTTSSRYPCL